MYNVLDHGIKKDGTTDNTQAIAALIGKMEQAGGGTLYFPAGKYVTGSIELKSNMTLYLEAGAEVLASEDRSRYPFVDGK